MKLSVRVTTRCTRATTSRQHRWERKGLVRPRRDEQNLCRFLAMQTSGAETARGASILYKIAHKTEVRTHVAPNRTAWLNSNEILVWYETSLNSKPVPKTGTAPSSISRVAALHTLLNKVVHRVQTTALVHWEIMKITVKNRMSMGSAIRTTLFSLFLGSSYLHHYRHCFHMQLYITSIS